MQSLTRTPSFAFETMHGVVLAFALPSSVQSATLHWMEEMIVSVQLAGGWVHA
jgi:hypothetical protein